MPYTWRMRTFLIAALLLSHAGVHATAPLAGQVPGRRVIAVSAERFEFWPSEITLAEGEEVEIRLQSQDTVHGFRIIGTSTNVIVPKRGRGEVAVLFRAERSGRFTFECSRMCGAGHNFMRGELKAGERSAGERSSGGAR